MATSADFAKEKRHELPVHSVGVLLFNGRLTTIFTLLISVLGLMMSLLYTRKTQEKYKRYLDSEVDSVDFQNNLIDNHITAQNEGAVPFLISQLEQKMSKEYAAKETNVNNHLFPKRLTEISYILSNVFLPSISFALVLVHMEAPIFLPTIILLSPRIIKYSICQVPRHHSYWIWKAIYF